jgi:hypothetical protein
MIKSDIVERVEEAASIPRAKANSAVDAALAAGESNPIQAGQEAAGSPRWPPPTPNGWQTPKERER